MPFSHFWGWRKMRILGQNIDPLVETDITVLELPEPNDPIS